MENVHDEVQKETLVHLKVIFVKIYESNALLCSRVLNDEPLLETVSGSF